MDWTNTSLLAKEQKGQSRMSWFLSSFGPVWYTIHHHLPITKREWSPRSTSQWARPVSAGTASLPEAVPQVVQGMSWEMWQKNFMGMLWVCPTRGICIEIMAISTEKRMVIMIIIWDNPRKLDAMFKKAQNRVRILHDNSGWGPAILSRLAFSGLSDVFTTLKKIEK